MRDSDTCCHGECYQHGKWRTRVRFHTDGEAILPDICPLCLLDEHESAADKAFESGFVEGEKASADELAEAYDKGFAAAAKAYDERENEE